MKIMFPIAAAGSGDAAGLAEKLFARMEADDHGLFPVGANHFWHGGIHLSPGSEPIRCIADGEVVAYRIDSKLRDYEVLPADPKAAKPQYSSGFVLVKHRHVTPEGQAIEFYSLYMHLAPVTEDDTKKDDLSDYPFIFRQTHALVCGDAEGGGMPIFDASFSQQQGVVPFGAGFTIADDDRCKTQRYRHVRTLEPTIGYAAFFDDGQVAFSPYDGTRARQGPTLDLLGDDQKPIPQKVAQGAFFVIEDPPSGHWTKKWHYERVVTLPGGDTAGFAHAAKGALRQVGHGEYYEVTTAVDLFEPGSGQLPSIAAGAVVKKRQAALPAWTKDAAHAQHGMEFVAVDVPVTGARGYALLKDAKVGSCSPADATYPLLDEGQASAGAIAAGSQYLVLERPADKDHWTANNRFFRVFVYDLGQSGGTDGYAFVRDDFAPALPGLPAGAARDLRVWAPPSANMPKHRVPAAPILPGADPDGKPAGELAVQPFAKGGKTHDRPTVFEVLDDSGTPAGHWSTTTGWRQITFSQPALCGGRQPALERKGLVFVGTPVDLDDDAGTGRVKTWSKVHDLKLGKKPHQGVAPEVALSYCSDDEWRAPFHPVEAQVHNAMRSWDGRYNGVALRSAGNADADLVGVLGAGTVVAFDGSVPWKLTTRDGKSAYTCTQGYYKLKEGQFVKISKDASDVVKRCQIPPDQLKFDKTVALSTPVPIRQGDVVGYAGSYLDQPNLLHFEIFTGDRDFTKNAKKDTWGDKICEVGTTAYRVREAIDLPKRSLPAHVSFELAERRRDYVRITLCEIVGWLHASDLSPAAAGAPQTLGKAVPYLAQDVRSLGLDKAGTEHFALVDKSRARIVGNAGDPVAVLDQKGDLVQVRALLGDLDGGWVAEGTLEASERTLRPDVGTYRYCLKHTTDVYDSDPSEAWSFRPPTDTEKASMDSAAASLVDPDAKKVRVPSSQVSRVRGHKAQRDDKGKLAVDDAVTPWVGVAAAAHGEPAFWVADPDVTVFSKPYDWEVSWTFLEEPGDYSDDGFCDVPSLLKLVDDHPDTAASADKTDGRPSADALAQAKKQRDALVRKLRTTACLHPSEWDASSVDKKYKRLQAAPWNMVDKDGKPSALYQQTVDHIKALQFWSDVGTLPDPSKIWHFEPIGFIRQMQSLGWVTRADLVAIAGDGDETVQGIDRYLIALNDTLEKYGVVTSHKLAHFFAQVTLECAYFTATTEEDPQDYSNMAGNTSADDGKRFIGRGLIQLTGRPNYEAYEKSVATDITSTDAAAQKVAALPMAVDSAGWYYDGRVKGHDNGAEDAVGPVTKAVNGWYNARGQRRMLFMRAKRVFYDMGEQPR